MFESIETSDEIEARIEAESNAYFCRLIYGVIRGMLVFGGIALALFIIAEAFPCKKHPTRPSHAIIVVPK